MLEPRASQPSLFRVRHSTVGQWEAEIYFRVLGLVKLWLAAAARSAIMCIRRSSALEQTQRWSWFGASTCWWSRCWFCWFCARTVRPETRTSAMLPAVLWSSCSTPDTTSVYIPTTSNMAQVSSSSLNGALAPPGRTWALRWALCFFKYYHLDVFILGADVALWSHEASAPEVTLTSTFPVWMAGSEMFKNLPAWPQVLAFERTATSYFCC